MNPLDLPRFAVTYQISMRSFNAAHIWRSWDRPGSKLVSVVEVDENDSEI